MRMKMILCMSLLAVSCLCGCSQNEKVSLSETYDAENISAINMQIDSWQLKIMVSGHQWICGMVCWILYRQRAKIPF